MRGTRKPQGHLIEYKRTEDEIQDEKYQVMQHENKHVEIQNNMDNRKRSKVEELTENNTKINARCNKITKKDIVKDRNR